MLLKKLLPPLAVFGAILLTIAISFKTLYGQSLRLDEAQSIWVYTKSVPTFFYLTAQDVLTPLYGFLLHFWLQIFGNTVIAARSLSLCFFVLTVPALYILVKRYSTTKTAILTIFLFSLSPFIVWYSNEARMYTLFLFATTLNHIFFLKMYRTDGKEGNIGFTLTAALGFYSHYFFIFLIATQGIYVFAKLFGILQSDNDFNYSPTRNSYQRYKQFTFLYLRQLAFAVLLFLPWILYVLSLGGASNTQPLIPAPSSFNIFQAFVNFLFGFQNQNIQGILISLWPLLVLLILFLFTQRKEIQSTHFEYFILLTFAPIILVFLASYIKPIFLTRYLILVTPTLFFVLAAILLSYSKRLSYFLTTVLLLLMALLLLEQNFSSTTPVKENYEGATDFLNQEVQPEDIVAVTSPFTIYPIEYYYNGPTRIETIPLWDRYAHGPIPPFSLANLKKQIATDQKQFADIYIVFSYDQGYEAQIKDYMEKHYQRLQKKQFSPGLEVREYKLRY